MIISDSGPDMLAPDGTQRGATWGAGAEYRAALPRPSAPALDPPESTAQPNISAPAVKANACAMQSGSTGWGGAASEGVDEEHTDAWGPRVGPSFQATMEDFARLPQSETPDRSFLLWRPGTVGFAEVDAYVGQAERLLTDPRLVGSAPELALVALHAEGGNVGRALAALPALMEGAVEDLWTEEESAALRDAVSTHGGRLRRVHATLQRDGSDRSYQEVVAQRARE